MREIAMSLTVDQVLRKIGQLGPYQIRILGFFLLIFFPLSYQTLIMVFVAYEPPWMCSANSSTCILVNSTGAEIFSTSTRPADLYNRRCNKLNRNDWKFADTELYEGPHYTIVTEWDLVCDRGFQAWLANSMLFFGWSVGALVLGTLSDKFGRKKVLFPSLAGLIIATFIMAFVEAPWLVMLCRFVVGLSEAGAFLTVFVLATELVGPERRALSGTLIWFFFTLALLVMTLKAYFIREWRLFSIICSIPWIFIVIFWRWVPESVRWLLTHGQQDEARKILQDVAATNKKEMPQEDLFVPMVTKDRGCLELFGSWQMTKLTLIQGFGWFVNGLVYYAISMSAGDFGGSIYINFILTSIIELPANVILIWSCNRFGRKKSVVWNFAGTALLCTATAFIPAGAQNNGYIAARRTGAVLARFCITISFNSIYIFSAELFPTVVRNSGMGLMTVVCRIGGAAAPFVVQMTRVHPTVPFAFMGALSLVAAILCWLLPETKGRYTAEVMHDTKLLVDGVDGNQNQEKISEDICGDEEHTAVKDEKTNLISVETTV